MDKVGENLSSWQQILLTQSEESPPRLSIEDALILYDDADLNDLMHTYYILYKMQLLLYYNL